MSNQRCIRSAYWIGKPKPGMEERFATLTNDTVIPAMRALPGVHDAWAMWPTSREDDPPAIACQIIVAFQNREDLARMLASPGRKEMRPTVVELKSIFDGHISHIEYDVV